MKVESLEKSQRKELERPEKVTVSLVKVFLSTEPLSSVVLKPDSIKIKMPVYFCVV